MKSWIGVDLDATLAHYEGWDGGTIGEPIMPMVNRVKKWLADGQAVKIFTARLCKDPDGEQERLIKAWSLEHIGQELEVTNVKDYGMIELWDDRVRQVIANTGELVQ